jgi:hypothetical protein
MSFAIERIASPDILFTKFIIGTIATYLFLFFRLITVAFSGIGSFFIAFRTISTIHYSLLYYNSKEAIIPIRKNMYLLNTQFSQSVKEFFLGVTIIHTESVDKNGFVFWKFGVRNELVNSVIVVFAN